MTDLAHLPPLTEEALTALHERLSRLDWSFAHRAWKPSDCVWLPIEPAIVTQTVDGGTLYEWPDTHDEWRELNEAQDS